MSCLCERFDHYHLACCCLMLSLRKSLCCANNMLTHKEPVGQHWATPPPGCIRQARLPGRQPRCRPRAVRQPADHFLPASSSPLPPTASASRPAARADPLVCLRSKLKVEAASESRGPPAGPRAQVSGRHRSRRSCRLASLIVWSRSRAQRGAHASARLATLAWWWCRFAC